MTRKILRIRFVFLLKAFLILMTSNTARSEGSSFSRMPFLKLDGNIIQAIAVPNILQCCWKCDRLPECFSLNVADVPDKDGLYVCQMLRTETNKYSGLLKPSKHFHHYTRFMDKCETTKCLNGGACESKGYDDFRCRCPKGFTGRICKEVKETYEWLKINTSPVCFGAKNSSYGSFYIKENGSVISVKLVHLSGYVTCHKNIYSEYNSYWGCGGNLETLNTIITDSANQKILPQDGVVYSSLSYSIPGFNSSSQELIFENFTSPMAITSGQEYRIWYGEDLQDYTEGDNDGTTCADVQMFGLFEQTIKD